MIEYMEYIVRSFQKSTNWNSFDGSNDSYENITATANSILNFQIPNEFQFQLSNKSTNFTYNTIVLSTNKVINGSLTYLYTDAENLNTLVKDTSSVNLQDVVETYKKHYKTNNNTKHFSGSNSLYYGRMYYPNSNLEAMVIKKFNPSTQIIVKWISSFNSYNIVTAYYQRNHNRTFQELIFSSNDMLCGYRFLHNFVESPSKFNNSLYNNSSLSIGAEAWLSVSALSPTCSTTLRYCTHSTNTGRPLTLTFSLNPLFGHLSSTYSAKTSSNSTFCAKYDFNLYSIESNLSLGCEFWKQQNRYTIKEETASTGATEKNDNDTIAIPSQTYRNSNHKQEKVLNELTTTFSSSLQQIDKERSIIENFQHKLYDNNFDSVWKFSTSLRDKNLCILWNGKFKGFLVSAGTELLRINLDNRYADTDSLKTDPSSQNFFNFYPSKLGVQIQYST